MSGVSEISSVVARGRLAVLTAHLTTATSSNEPIEGLPPLEPNCLSAQVSPPGNLAGSLTVVDGRTGKKYQVPVSEDGTVKATDLKKVCLMFLRELFFVFWKAQLGLICFCWVLFCFGLWYLFMIWVVVVGEIFSEQRKKIGFWNWVLNY